MATVLRRDRETLAALATAEMGKVHAESLAEIEKCAVLCDWYADNGAAFLRDEPTPVADNKACECGAILRGVKKPTDCKIFGTVCTPENPVGSCMVSSEGACAAHYAYGRFKDIPVVTA